MKEKLTAIVLALSSLLLMNSCAVYAQDDVYVSESVSTPSVSIIVEYGTPFIIDGLIRYYFYDGFYYYPIYRNGYIYGMHHFRRPLPPRQMRHYIPVPRDYVHSPHHHNALPNNRVAPPTQNKGINQRPNGERVRPQSTDRGRFTPNRSSTYENGRNRTIQQPRQTISRPNMPTTRGMNGNSSRPSNGNGHFGGRR